MIETTATDLLQQVFGWGWGDTNEICSLVDAFNVELNDIDFDETGKEVNQVIYEIFYQAVQNVNQDLDTEYEMTYNDNGPITYYLNSIDSHLYVGNEEVFSYDELAAAVKALTTVVNV